MLAFHASFARVAPPPRVPTPNPPHAPLLPFATPLLAALCHLTVYIPSPLSLSLAARPPCFICDANPIDVVLPHPVTQQLQQKAGRGLLLGLPMLSSCLSPRGTGAGRRSVKRVGVFTGAGATPVSTTRGGTEATDAVECVGAMLCYGTVPQSSAASECTQLYNGSMPPGRRRRQRTAGSTPVRDQLSSAQLSSAHCSPFFKLALA
jgi:hypothetical protein